MNQPNFGRPSTLGKGGGFFFIEKETPAQFYSELFVQFGAFHTAQTISVLEIHRAVDGCGCLGELNTTVFANVVRLGRSRR